jgi:hypothetical protein
MDGPAPAAGEVLNAPYVTPFAVRGADGRHYVLLMNFSSDTYPAMALSGSVFEKRSPAAIAQVLPERDRRAPGIEAGTVNGMAAIILRKPLAPYDYVLLRVG